MQFEKIQKNPYTYVEENFDDSFIKTMLFGVTDLNDVMFVAYS